MTRISAVAPAAICPDAGVTLNGMYEDSPVSVSDVMYGTRGRLVAVAGGETAATSDCSAGVTDALMITGVPDVWLSPNSTMLTSS